MIINNNKKQLYDIVQTRKGNLAIIVANKKDEFIFFRSIGGGTKEDEKDAFRVHFFDSKCTERKEWFHPDDLTIIGNIPEILAKLKHLEFEIKLLK